MLGSTRRRRAYSALATLVGGAGLVALPAAPASAVVVPNACYNSATTALAPVEADVVGSVPASVTPGQSFSSTGMGVDLVMPGQVFVTGYNLGLVQDGQMVAGKIRATIAASNTAEGQQDTNLVDTEIGPIDITDPDGTPGTGDETAAPASASVSFADMSWTAGNSGEIALREASVPIANASGGGGLQIDANLGFTVRFRCSPGTVDTVANTASWTTAAPFATSQVNVPAAAPVAVDDSASVGANQATSINVVANDSDANGDLDSSTVTITSGPAAGTATANPDGTVTYTNTGAAASDSFTYTVADEGGLVSNEATVSISILGDTCDASSDACSLDQVVEVEVNGAGMTIKQAGSLVTLPAVTLNGKPQKTMGALNGLTVVNARGTDAGWSLTGQMTSDFSDGTGDGVCPAGDPSTWDNHCIPGGNVGWAPSAEVAHDVIPGDVADVDAGAPLPQGGLDEARTLCQAPANHSGGTFECGGGIGLGIPASAAAGLYQATLTLTLV